MMVNTMIFANSTCTTVGVDIQMQKFLNFGRRPKSARAKRQGSGESSQHQAARPLALAEEMHRQRQVTEIRTKILR